MNLSAPKQIVFILACIMALIGFLGGIGVLPFIVMAPFAWVTAAFVLLAAGNLLKGL